MEQKKEMNDYDLLDEFGKQLITQVRDNALDDVCSIINGRMKSSAARQISDRIASTLNDDGKQVLHTLAANAIDRVLHYLLTLIEQNKSISLSVSNEGNLTELNKVSDGLAGELYSEEGWISRFSKYPPSCS